MDVEEAKIPGEKKKKNPIVNFYGNKVIISSDFRERLEESKGNVIILNRENGDIMRTITWRHDGLEDGMNVDIDGVLYKDPILIWDFFGSNMQSNSIWYDHRYDRIYFSDFLWNIDVYDTSSWKLVTNILIKSHRSDISQQEDRLTNNIKEVVFSINLNDSFIYITTNFYIYAVKRNDLKVVASMNLNGLPIKINFSQFQNNERELLKAEKDELFMSKIIFGFSDRTSLRWSTIYHFIKSEDIIDANGDVKATQTSCFKLASEGAMEKITEIEYPSYRRIFRPLNNYYQYNESINSVDVSNSLAVCAAKDMKISVFDIGTGTHSLKNNCK